ncbi:MAG: proprotein convertase P-domain-containing protein, partial [Deltaproteobacteria bacterium]|nr:proprotein convertase P-domain-containing protein [Deltaproteobacteria bacterium]
GDTCQSGVCQEGVTDPCAGDPCANLCDEISDLCGGCAPAGTQCMNPVQEATCDGACTTIQLIICEYGCNLARDECNECAPSTVECKGDVEFLCNAEFVCDANGLLQSKTCCTTNRCACDASACLEDMCAAAPDLSAGGNLAGDTCGPDGIPGTADDSPDNIPGDCNPGGSACQDVLAGGAPEELFQFTLDDGTGDSAFYQVTLDSSILSAMLRVSTICGSETAHVNMADVCGAPPGTTPDESCYGWADPNQMVLCGLPEGTYYGAVDSPPGVCGAFSLDVTIPASPVSLDTGAEAGNISMGGSFSGNTCAGLNDNYKFPDEGAWAISTCPGSDCYKLAGVDYCPDCGVSAATDCTIPPNTEQDKCTYSGENSNEAVFHMALEFPSGVDISTAGSDFDTVLYIMETGPNGADPPGGARICNDDCWLTDVDGASHIQTSLPAGVYYVYVDGAGGDCGNFDLSVIISPAANCGNMSCEAPYENCTNCPPDCQCPNCGDGTINTTEGEECDDGDTDDGDGCSGICSVEGGYVCSGQPSVCTPGGSSCPGSVIPDGDPGGMTDVINIPIGWTINDINVDVDISHTWIGDLIVELSSPGGTTVRLHDRSGADGDNIITNYDLVTSPDGPGSMADFDGENTAGDWTLFVSDSVAIDSGMLNCWSIHFDTP